MNRTQRFHAIADWLRAVAQFDGHVRMPPSEVAELNDLADWCELEAAQSEEPKEKQS